MRSQRCSTSLALLFAASLVVAPLHAQEEGTAPTTAPVAEVPPQPEPGQPVMDVNGLGEIFRLTVQNGFLSLKTDLTPTEVPVFVRTAGLPLGGEVTVNAAGGDMGQRGGLRSVQFTTPPNTAANPLTKTLIAAMPGSMHISQDSEFGPWVRSVQYIQQVPFEPVEVAEPPVKLYVNMHSTVSDTAPVKLQLTAGSFVEMRERYPSEVSLYLVPLFALLQQESLFAPDPLVARRALLRQETTVDADLTKKVTDLVAKLGDGDQKVRSDAYVALDALGEPAANVLTNIDRASLSAEQNATIDALLAARLGTLPQEMKEVAQQPMFLLDCLYLDDAALRAAAFDRLKAQTKLPLEFDPKAPLETRRAQALKVRTQVNSWATTQPSAGAN